MFVGVFSVEQMYTVMYSTKLNAGYKLPILLFYEIKEIIYVTG